MTMIRLLVCLGCLLGLNTLLAQPTLMDSLYAKLEAPASPIHKVDYLLGLVRMISAIDNKTPTEATLDEAIALARKHNYSRGEIIGLLLKSVSAGNKSEIDKSFEFVEQAKAISRESKEQSTRVMILYMDAENYSYFKNDIPTALQLLHTALEEASSLTPYKDIGNVHKNLGICYAQIGKDSLAFHHFDRALEYFQRRFVDAGLGEPSAMEFDRGRSNSSQIYIYKGRLHEKRGRYDLAVQNTRKALQIYLELGTKYSVAWAYENLGIQMRGQGKIKEAIENFQQAKSIYEEVGDPVDLGMINYEIGLCYEKTEDYQNALLYYDRYLKNVSSTTDTVLITKALISMGNINLATDQWAAAERYFNQASALSQVVSDSSNLDVVYRGLSSIAAQRGGFEQAAIFLREAIAIARQYGNVKAELDGYIKLGTLHLQQGQLDSASVFLLQALRQPFAEIYQLEDLYHLLSTIYKRQGNYEQALRYHEAYFHAHDSIYTLNAQELLKQEQVRQNIEAYQEEKELATLQAELLTSQNRLYLALASALLLLLLVGSYLFLQLRRIKATLENKNQQLTELNHTKDKFFGIIAHDIRSPIQALESVGKQMDYYLENGKMDKLKRLSSRVDFTAKRLNALLDNLLNWALLQQGVIPNHPATLSLNRIVEHNIQMFQVSADLKDIQIQNELAEELNVVADENALNTILRNLLSNAIKFTPKGGSVRIEAEREARQVLVKVRDTGVGMEPQFMKHIFALNSKRAQGTAGERGTGLGLMLCRELVRLNQGDIRVESKPQQGSDFLVTLPLAA